MPSKCHIIKMGGGLKLFVDFLNRGVKKFVLEIGEPN
jgi:hypothetical protein